ncbi:MAG: hypothetical protein ACYC9K_08075 [Sulfuricaulis sp.]
MTRDLGISPNLLTRWCWESADSEAKTFPSPGKPRDEKLAALKREFAQTRKERDFLREVAVDSIDQCNTTCSNQGFGGMWYGTTWMTRHDRYTERRGLASLAPW